MISITYRTIPLGALLARFESDSSRGERMHRTWRERATATPQTTALLPEMTAMLVALNRARLMRDVNDANLRLAVARCADAAHRAKLSPGELASRVRTLVEYAFSSETDAEFARVVLAHMLQWARMAPRDDALIR